MNGLRLQFGRPGVTRGRPRPGWLDVTRGRPAKAGRPFARLAVAPLAFAPPALLAFALPAVALLAASCGSSPASSATAPSPLSNTTAAQLAATMNDALRNAHSLTGSGVARITTTSDTQVCDFSFATTAQGDYRLALRWRKGGGASAAAPSGRSLLVYNAGEHTLVTRSRPPAPTATPTGATQASPSDSATAAGDLPSVQIGVPGFAVFSGVQDLQGFGLFDPQFAATARAALAAQGKASIAGSKSEGRPVWDTTVAIPWPTAPTGRVLASVHLVVDQTSGLTRTMTLAFADGWRARIDYTDLRVDAPMPASAFDTSAAAKAAGSSVPSGSAATASPAPLSAAAATASIFRFLPLDEAQSASGVAPLLPTFTLSGFTLSQVAVAATGRQGSFGQATDLWLLYRGGLESYQLRLQRAPFGMTPDWQQFAGLTTRALDHGPFADEPARMWVDGVPQGTFDFVGPGLFVENGQEVARFAGDLLPYESWQVANSLKPWSP